MMMHLDAGTLNIHDFLNTHTAGLEILLEELHQAHVVQEEKEQQLRLLEAKVLEGRRRIENWNFVDIYNKVKVKFVGIQKYMNYF